MMCTKRVAVLIPSYDRPEILKVTLLSWLKASCVNKVFVVAQASSKDKLEEYRRILERFKGDDKLIYMLVLGRLGSIKARNLLLDMALKYHQDYNYVVMVDDDCLPHYEKSLMIMMKSLELDSKVGAVGGRVIAIKRRRGDPDFFLNLPTNLANLLTRLTGYIFLDIKHGPRYSEFLQLFLIMRKELLNMVRFDEAFNTPTSFREESDFQQQIKQRGYKLLFVPQAYVLHLVPEEGGNRPRIDIKRRMYWKIRNHTVFIFKWNNSIIKRIWYLFLATLILLIYRPWHVFWILKGLQDGIYAFKNTFEEVK